MADHYAVLGLAPYAEHSAIRAAYLGLMRRYHPDINSSAEAAARAREVTAAYEVLGSPDSRTDYDLARAHAQAAMADHRSRGLRSPLALAGLAALGSAAIVTLVFLMPSKPEDRTEQAAALATPSRSPQQERRAPVRSAPGNTESAKRADAKVAGPVQVAQSPPRVAIAPAPLPAAVKHSSAPVDVKRAAQPTAAATPPAPRIEPQHAAARVDDSAALAGLDRHLGTLFRQSVRRADAAKQQSLYRDHYRFIARLNGCSTDVCKKREYLARMGEVSSTMAAPAKPR